MAGGLVACNASLYCLGANSRNVGTAAAAIRFGFTPRISNSSALRSFKQQRVGVQRRRKHLLVVRAAKAPDDGVKWWQKDGGPNMRDVHSTEELIDALANAGDKLVIVEFYATWCGSCRALYPKLCKLAEEHRDIEFLKVNFEENKPMCKRLGIKVLPYFQFYRGADGRLDAFSCSLAKLQKLKDAIEAHSSARCMLGPTLGVGDVLGTSAGTPDQRPTAAGSR